jgi:hypothetical protein
MRVAGIMLWFVLVAFANDAFGQGHFVKRVPKDPLDLGAEINAQIASLPTIGGYKAGTVTIPPGVYFQSSAVIINSPRVSVIGAGAGAVQITCTMDSACWDLRLNPFVADPQVGGQFGGFQLIGLSTNPNAVGIHMGDIAYLRLEDIVIQGFTGINAAGMWWENINGWTERNNVQRVNLYRNTTDFRFTNSGGPVTTSFCYNQLLDLRMNVGPGQKGIDFQSGVLCGSTFMLIVNGIGAGKTYINIAGQGQWHDNLYEIRVEDDGGGGVRLATAPGTNFEGIGFMTNIIGNLTDSIGGGFSMFLPYTIGTTYSSTSGPARWWTDQFGNLVTDSTLAATSSANFNSPLISMKGNCWDGSKTAISEWTLQNVLTPPPNAAGTFEFGFGTGCATTPQVQVTDNVGSGLLLSTTAPGTTPRIRHDAEDNLVIDTGGSNASLYLNTDNNKGVKLGAGGTTGANIPILASVATTSATSTSVNMPGVTSSSHCSLTATNAAAGANIGNTFISAKTTDVITVSHAPIAGMNYDLLCTPN